MPNEAAGQERQRAWARQMFDQQSDGALASLPLCPHHEEVDWASQAPS